MIRIEQYNIGDKLPELLPGIFFHSKDFFHILEHSSGIKPVMFVAYENENEIGHMLTMFKRDFRIIPPGIYHWCSIYSEGTYRNDCNDHNKYFSMFIENLLRIIDFKYMFIEVRYIEDSRTTYQTFSKYNFIPRHDLRIYNSLHSRQPEERLSRAYHTHIKQAITRGVTYKQATDTIEIENGLNLLKNYYTSKIKRYFAPTDLLMKLLANNENNRPQMRMFTVYNKKKRMIGCSICLYHNDRAFLLYSCGLRKSYPLLYPGIISIWVAIKDAHQRGFQHFEFAISGMPLNKNIGFRNFLLNFGGKQTSTIHWYRFRWNWINKILRKIYV